MTINRRSFVMSSIAGVIALPSLNATALTQPAWRNIKALAFDAFPIFDPRPVFLACEQAFPGRGTELANQWRTRQFEYQWLRALGGQYENFWDATQSALDFAARSLQIDLSASVRAALMQHYLQLKAWPDVSAALAALRQTGKRLAIVSNATPEILNASLKNSDLEAAFDHVISTDRIRSFKPDPRAYQLGVDMLGVRKQEIMFVAFAGWDVAGAKWFGYPTFWNNRQNAPDEQLGVIPDGVGSLAELVRFLEPV